MFRRSSSLRGLSCFSGSSKTASSSLRAVPATRSSVVVTGTRALRTQSRLWNSTSSILARDSSLALLLAGSVAVSLGTVVYAESKVDYAKIRKEIASLLEAKDEDYDDGSFGPLLVRLAWHAAGTYDAKTGKYGSNGATMRFKPENEHGANNGLALARKLLEPIKRAYPDLSYADLWTLAGAVAIEELGGPVIPWRPGRVDAPDGSVCPPDGHLPDASKGPAHIRQIFYRMGFNDKEIVALAGAHCLGRCHRDRSGFLGPWTRAPTTFSNEYFRELLENTWTKKKWDGPEQYTDPTGELMMLPADLAFIQDPAFRKHVEAYARDEQLFFKDFAAAFSKLMENGVPAFRK